MRRLADQIGFADAGEIWRQACDAAFLGLAAGDPENIGITGQGPCRGIGIGGLGIVDESGLADAAHIFHAMGEAGKAGDRGGDDARIFHENPGGGIGQRHVLPIMRARQMRRFVQLHHLGGALAFCAS